jgi:hypothetical protein
MMTNRRKKEIEFRLIEDEEMPPMIIKANEDGNPVIVINQHHRIWLSLQRRTIPGIVESLSHKLNDICDGYLNEQLIYETLE